MDRVYSAESQKILEKIEKKIKNRYIYKKATAVSWMENKSQVRSRVSRTEKRAE